MKTIEFETCVKNSYIEIPDVKNLESRHVKVILMWDIDKSGAEKKNKEHEFSTPFLKTRNFRFDRQEANARQ